MNERLAFMIGLFVLLINGCASIGPTKLVSSHEGYNDAVQLVNTREVLMNIVRERYMDPVQFMTVSTINAGFSVTAGANISGSTNTSGVQVGSSIGYSESPNITFTPLGSAGLIKSLGRPVDLTILLNFGFQQGDYRPEHLELFIAAINNAPDRSGSRGELFRQRAQALNKLLQLGCRLGQRRIMYPRHEPFSPEGIDARAYIDAAKNGLYFVDVGNGMLSVASKHFIPVLVVPDPEDPEVVEQFRILDVEPGADWYALRPPTQLQIANTIWSPNPDGRVAQSIYLIPRSVADVLSIAAKYVETPLEQDKTGIAPPIEKLLVNSSVELPMKIRFSRSQPPDEYRVFHRGHWFYIDDTDYVSKSFFSAIVYAYTLTIGTASPRDPAPTLTLPVGAR